MAYRCCPLCCWSSTPASRLKEPLIPASPASPPYPERNLAQHFFLSSGLWARGSSPRATLLSLSLSLSAGLSLRTSVPVLLCSFLSSGIRARGFPLALGRLRLRPCGGVWSRRDKKLHHQGNYACRPAHNTINGNRRERRQGILLVNRPQSGGVKSLRLALWLRGIGFKQDSTMLTMGSYRQSNWPVGSSPSSPAWMQDNMQSVPAKQRLSVCQALSKSTKKSTGPMK